MNKDPETGKDTTPVKDEEGNYIEEATTDYDNAYEYNRKESGDILPNVYGGLGTTFAWKGLDFAIQTSFQLGGRIYDQGYSDLMTTGGTSFSAGHNFHKDVLKAWSEDNTSSNIPRVDFTDKYATSFQTVSIQVLITSLSIISLWDTLYQSQCLLTLVSRACVSMVL